MKKLKVKIIVGFRADQEYSIDIDEAHKAYYLFMHPDQRGVFKNGIAIVGAHIKEIVPDWQGTMGWNPSHVLGGPDWNEIRETGLRPKMELGLECARQIAAIGKPEHLNLPLQQVVQEQYPQLLEAKTTGLRPLAGLLKK